MLKLKTFIVSLPAIIITILIFILSDQPEPELLGIKFNIYDKLLHISAFFIYGLSLFFFYIVNFRNQSKNKIILLVVLTGSLYGIFDEFHQSFVPGRQTEFLDWLADFIGICFSILFYDLIRKIVEHFFKSNKEI
jgi:VanZ family protein